jgi:hypothetical protein
MFQHTFQKSFVVLAFPRTGSTLIIGNLNEYFKTDALQTHDFNYVPPHENYTCVITKRQDVFSCVASHLVMNRTGESSAYSNKSVEPFVADPLEMQRLLKAFDVFHANRNLSHYKHVIEVDFDRLISDSYYLFRQFNIVEKTMYNIERSPYRYQDLITNLDELKDVFNRHQENRDSIK